MIELSHKSALPRASSLTSVPLQADKNDAYLFPVKVDEKVAKLHLHATQCGAHGHYSGTSRLYRCQSCSPLQKWALPSLRELQQVRPLRFGR